ncbi:hypothetical protein C8Q73DRAFT_683066 [Cubamyces lactineus]|nr:hypothetical protein C8Q73DRAFT_683066 [Cubamyces lactineus]
MSLKALFYAYILGGLTFLPLVIFGAIFWTVYTSVPVGDPDADKFKRGELEAKSEAENEEPSSTTAAPSAADLNDVARPRKGWLTVRRTFEETPGDASYVGMVRGFLDARSKDPKRSRPKDMWYVALKGQVLYLYEDESMTECEAAIQLGVHDVVIYPEGLPDGELFAKRNAICLKPKASVATEKEMPSVTKEMKLGEENVDEIVEEKGGNARQKQRERERLAELEKKRDEAREQALDVSTPWFIFVRSAVEMEDWYLALVHASDNPPNTSTLDPLKPVFKSDDMSHLVSTLDEQPDVIPMRWLNALLGRIFFSYYRTHTLESYIIGRLMKKISRVKRPGFLTDIVVREVSVGNRTPTLSKPMLKELTKEGDAALEVHLSYKGEVRITVEATATINLGARFKTYTVKLVLALVLREIEGNLLVKVKRPPSSRIWYAFTQMPRVVLDVEPVVSDRQITWSMILSTIESKVKEVIQESVVLPNMDDIAFFESSQYQHRGGIWADASRRERTPSTPEEEPLPSTDGTSTPASAPVTETSKPEGEETQLPPIQRSRSAEIEKTSVSASPPEATPIVRAATDVASTPAVGTSPSARRRSWFPSVQEDVETPVPSVPEPSDIDEGEPRGRTSAPDIAMSRRSSSTPNTATPKASQDDNAPFTEDPGDEGQYLTPDASHRRSSSQHSRSASSRAASFSSQGGDVSDEGSDPQMATYRSKSPAPSGSSPRQTPTSPSSFLQTLKSRAGDKQALSNTAKEAMRKWTVNWNNFRRDNAASTSSTPVAEEVPDGGHGDQRRIDSRTQIGRPSYAEVRAAVAERRERERAPLVEGSSRSNQHASEPIPVPQNGKGKEALGAEDASPAQSRLTASSPSDEGAPPRSVSPAAAMLPVERTDSHVSTTSRESASQVLGIAPEEPERPPSPIHTQPPPPKTMTIPGIHASHRGEVMSMGYVAPQPAPPETKKVPLQSVYRLWKNPGAANSTRSEPVPVSQTGFSGRDQDSAQSQSAASSNDTDAPAPAPSPAVPAPAQARPVPPPLPPRANSTHVLQTRPEVPRPPDVDAQARSAASAALQSIVSKDKDRAKRLSFSPPSSPGQNGSAAVERSEVSAAERLDALDHDGAEVTTSPLSLTPVPSSPPTPPAQVPNGRGPPPALPPRRVRTSA